MLLNQTRESCSHVGSQAAIDGRLNTAVKQEVGFTSVEVRLYVQQMSTSLRSSPAHVHAGAVFALSTFCPVVCKVVFDFRHFGFFARS